MSEISRRNALKGAAWSVPAIAAAVATPMAAASGFAVTITGMENTDTPGRGNLRVAYANFNAGLAVQGHLTWTPSGSGYTESSTFTPRASGNSLLLARFTPGVRYTFIVTILGGPSPVSAYFDYTF